MIDPQTLCAFARRVEADELASLIRDRLDCIANRDNCKTTIKPGKKYTKVDVGRSGRYMVENDTGRIYGIKAYGVIHRVRYYGVLDDFESRKSWARF